MKNYVAPKNARSSAQIFLIYHHLYYQYLLYNHSNNEIVDLPLQQKVFVEEEAGTGKGFIIKTICNINRKIDDLPNYKKFYVFSMSNARSLESILCKKFNMGNKNVSGGIYTSSKYVYVFNEKIAKQNNLI